MATLRGMIMPDVIGSFNQGREVGEEQRTKRTLSQFMQPAIGGDQQALSEIYRADPQAGYRVQQAATQEQEQALGREDKRKERLGQMARQLIALPEAMRPAAYRQLIPELSTFGLETVPPDYTSEVDDVVRQVAEALAPQTANKMFSQKIGANGNILNTLADGRVVDTGIKADRQAWFRDQPGADPVIVNKDGSIVEPGAQATTQFTGPDGLPINIGNDVDPAVRAQILANPGAFNSLPDGSTATLPPVNRQPGLQARPLMTPAQEQQMLLAQRAAARADEQLALARRAQDRADRAAAFARQQADAKSNSGGTRQADAQATLDLLTEAEELIGRSTGSTMGNLFDKGAAALGQSTEGAKAIAALATIAGQLTSKMPRMQGPQSDKDVQMYKQMAGDLANPETPRETRLAALATIRRLNEKYARQPAAPARPAAAQPSRPASDDEALIGKYL